MTVAMRIAKFPQLPGFGPDIHAIGAGSVVPPLPVPPVPAAPWMAIMCNYSSLLIFGKYTITTRTDGLGDALMGNDWGMLQPHFPLPPIAASNIPSVLTGSSHKHFLPAYAVIETPEGGAASAIYSSGTPIAVCSPICMILLQDCGDPVSLPNGIQFHLPTTRWVGMTFCDLLAGLFSMVADQCTDKVTDSIFEKLLPDGFLGAILGAAIEAVIEIAADVAKDQLPEALGDTVAATAVMVGLGSIAAPVAAAFALGRATDAIGEAGRSAPE